MIENVVYTAYITGAAFLYENELFTFLKGVRLETDINDYSTLARIMGHMNRISALCAEYYVRNPRRLTHPNMMTTSASNV